MFFYSPLEQFSVLPIVPVTFGIFDLSLTNEVVIMLLVFGYLITFIKSLTVKDGTFYIIPNRWQMVLEMLYDLILSMVLDNIKHKDAEQYFPLIFTVFVYVLMLNLIGLVPYSFTITSHLIVTVTLALSLFIGINIICVRANGLKYFRQFLPGGMGIGFAFLLVPIELISYFVKPISLSVRLFANMMAGHTLLKVIAGFGFILMGKSGAMFITQYIPLLVLVPLFGLELAVAAIQAFVFSILTCIYINDALNIH